MYEIELYEYKSGKSELEKYFKELNKSKDKSDRIRIKKSECIQIYYQNMDQN